MIMSDTHVPPRARDLPAPVWDEVDRDYPDVDLLVFGHSHIPWNTVSPGGLRLLNPGSPTDRRRQPACTYLTASVRTGVLDDVLLHGLPGRR